MKLPDDTTVIHGAGGTGVDLIVDGLSRSIGYKVKTYPVQWAQYGKAAEVIRNRQMIDNEKPDILLCFLSIGMESEEVRKIIHYANNKNYKIYVKLMCFCMF